MLDDFVIALNPEEGTTLPYLLRVPLGPDGIVLKTKEVWPRTGKVYCHRAVGWPREPEVVERVPVRSCVRRGAAIDLVLDRKRENRSQFVLTRIRGGREAIFWQTARTARQARPAVALPTARGSGVGGWTSSSTATSATPGSSSTSRRRRRGRRWRPATTACGWATVSWPRSSASRSRTSSAP